MSNFLMFRAGYDEETVECVFEILASAARQSAVVAHSLAHGSVTLRSSTAETSSMLKSSLANLISGKSHDLVQERHMASALKLIEACLGAGGGGSPGLYLPGLQFDPSGRLRGVEYGVLDP